VAASMLDSVTYGALWRSAPLAELFDEVPRTRAWLEILAVLAEVEAEHGLIPAEAAAGVAATCRALVVDGPLLEELARARQATGHSTAGLIQAVARRCPPGAGEWVHYGATVQDVADTWLMSALRAARAHFLGRLDAARASLAALARRHRDTVMPGRTHGQQGLPITLGFKVAGWVAELRRHRQRLEEAAVRMDVGQLGGGVGSLAAFGPQALALQARFCARLGLRPPPISWTSSRDVLAEWGALATLITGTADRIGHEVYNLQRDELGELGEAPVPGLVGSITMPHKRNPELAEHLGTLARVVRHEAAVLLEGLVHDHERDGRAWKAEWLVIPELTLLAGRAVELLAELAAGLTASPARMLRNLGASGGALGSEALMLAVARGTGRETAHRLVYAAAERARAAGRTLAEVALETPEILRHVTPAELAGLLDPARHTGQCAALVDRVLDGEG
jgi:adenylosuccinate lyase